MSNNAGGDLFQGNSKLFSGPLGVVDIGLRGYYLGRTTADSVLTPDQDIKDIIFQQEGTKASDHVRTGQDVILKATFGEINTGLLVQLMAGITTANTDPNSDSGDIGRNLYQSMRDTEAGALRIVAIDSDGSPSEEDEDTFNFYEAIPIVNADLIVWGADTQRNLPVEFRIKYHKFETGESVAKKGSFGYWGDPVPEDLPPVVWPSVSGPEVASATIVDATSLTVTFTEVITLVPTRVLIDRISTLVDDDVNIPVSAIIDVGPNDNRITCTYAAATFAAGDVVKWSMSKDTVEDADNNSNNEIVGLTITNPLV